MPITASDFQNIELAIAAYRDERYTLAKKLVGTGMVGSDDRLETMGESYIGQMRMYDTVNPTFNTPSLSTATDGTTTGITTRVSSYIKSATAFGYEQVNLQHLVSQENGFDKMARDMAEMMAQDRDAKLVSAIKGVAASEAGVGAGGYVDFDSHGNAALGFYVDINALGHFGAAATGTGDARKLIDSSAVGAARGTRLFKALGMAFGDYEPDYMYMLTSPEMLAELREANLVDDVVVQDGNLTFQTIFGGKFRLYMTRTAQGDRSGDTNVNAQSTKTTFLIAPNAIKFREMSMDPTPSVEIDRDASTYFGGGSTEVWHRWGQVVHPAGYSWSGATNAFPTNATMAAAASWTRDADPLNLQILPIFHA